MYRVLIKFKRRLLDLAFETWHQVVIDAALGVDDTFAEGCQRVRLKAAAPQRMSLLPPASSHHH